MRPVAAPTEKVRLVHLATGEVYEAWPIDAKAHLDAGDFVREADYVPPAPDETLTDAPKPRRK